MKILVAGASGLVGSALIPALESDGGEINRLVRSSPKGNEIEWHPNHGQIDTTRLEGFVAIINLAGENIAEGRWTDEKKGKIHDSRVNGTQLVARPMSQLSEGSRA